MGGDGLLFIDSQNLMYDVFASLNLAATVTGKIKLGTAVTNLETRHPAVVANAFATLQHVSVGRAYLGVGRGDTAVELIGQRPLSVQQFGKSFEQLQSLLRGMSVDVEGFSSHIVWLPEEAVAKVPMRTALRDCRSCWTWARPPGARRPEPGVRPEVVGSWLS